MILPIDKSFCLLPQPHLALPFVKLPHVTTSRSVPFTSRGEQILKVKGFRNGFLTPQKTRIYTRQNQGCLPCPWGDNFQFQAKQQNEIKTIPKLLSKLQSLWFTISVAACFQTTSQVAVSRPWLMIANDKSRWFWL